MPRGEVLGDDRASANDAAFANDYLGVDEAFCGNPAMSADGDGFRNKRESGLVVVVGACAKVCALRYYDSFS